MTKCFVVLIFISFLQSNVHSQYSQIWERQITIGGGNTFIGAENTDSDNQKEILIYDAFNASLYLLDGLTGDIEWQSDTNANFGTLIDIEGDGQYEILQQGGVYTWYLYGLAGTKISEINRSVIKANNYPNPFNQITTIKYTVPENLTRVKIKIFDGRGQEIKTLVDEIKSAGEYEILFNGYNFSNGMYYYQISIGNEVGSKKMLKMD